VHEIISGLSIRGCKNPQFADEVLRFAQGVEWDTDGLARTGAISALPRVTGCTEQIKSTLRLAYRSGDTSLRDVALEAAQEYFGIPYADIQWGNGDGDLVDKMPPALLKWLGVEISH